MRSNTAVESGGFLMVDGSTVVVTISNSICASNLAVTDAGCISAPVHTTVKFDKQSDISYNEAACSGGAISRNFSTIDLHNTVIKGIV